MRATTLTTETCHGLELVNGQVVTLELRIRTTKAAGHRPIANPGAVSAMCESGLRSGVACDCDWDQ